MKINKLKSKLILKFGNLISELKRNKLLKLLLVTFLLITLIIVTAVLVPNFNWLMSLGVAIVFVIVFTCLLIMLKIDTRDNIIKLINLILFIAFILGWIS